MSRFFFKIKQAYLRFVYIFKENFTDDIVEFIDFLMYHKFFIIVALLFLGAALINIAITIR